MLGMVVYYQEVMCHEEKLVHYLQCQGHSEGLHNENIDYFAISSTTAGPFVAKLGLLVQHHTPECHVVKWDYCIQSQGHSEGSKC